MRGTQQLRITPTSEMAQMVQRKVSTGEHAGERAVIRGGMPASQAHDKLDNCLRTEGTAAYDQLKADPTRALTADQVRERLAAKRKRPGSV
ncbi:MAG TPA: type II toxin-antitoxin system ParD family antitoxin [Devosiaceae bacterium]